jgi:SPP1 gp7 family putative phage head morphogenesis protein
MTSSRQLDPTRTTLLRKAFAMDSRKRFDSIKKAVYYNIVDRDVFGINPITNQDYFQERELADKPVSEKVDKFTAWLASIGIMFLLEKANNYIDTMWTDRYVDEAFIKGKSRAVVELKKQNYPQEEIPDVSTQSIMFALSAGILTGVVGKFADMLGLTRTQTRNDYRKINADMEQDVRRTLSDGLLKGLSSKELAKSINERVDVYKVRGDTVASTETVKAHHVAMVSLFIASGVEEASIEAEWRTAQDDRVCPICAPRNGKIYPMSEIIGMIPVHPRCRCIALPATIKNSI